MESNEVVLIFDYDKTLIDWEAFPESQQIQVGETQYIFPKKRFAEMAFIVNDFKKENKKVKVII